MHFEHSLSMKYCDFETEYISHQPVEQTDFLKTLEIPLI
jgi:hypothetical protein